MLPYRPDASAETLDSDYCTFPLDFTGNGVVTDTCKSSVHSTGTQPLSLYSRGTLLTGTAQVQTRWFKVMTLYSRILLAPLFGT
jgi:hypothetical protein